jgi:hypothetical protein
MQKEPPERKCMYVYVEIIYPDILLDREVRSQFSYIMSFSYISQGCLEFTAQTGWCIRTVRALKRFGVAARP